MIMVVVQARQDDESGGAGQDSDAPGVGGLMRVVHLHIRTLVSTSLLCGALLLLALICLTYSRKEDMDQPQPQQPRALTHVAAAARQPSGQERQPKSLGNDYHVEVVASNSVIQEDVPTQVPNTLLTERQSSILKEADEWVRRGQEEVYNQVATATAGPSTSLDDIFISVKTTKSFHKTRLDLILKTWFPLARQQTWFFSDVDDEEYQKKTGGHLLNTNCSATHHRRALCCKMAREFDAFLESTKRWWCHFDDDNYVNIASLVRVLGDYDPLQDWYLGKPSIRAPLEIINRDDKTQQIYFWFATGGAGFCISRALGLKMMPIASGGKFISVGEKIRLPDDVTMGYIIEHMLHKKLTVIDEFHSHLEPMQFINTDQTLQNQVSLTYSQYNNDMNVLNIQGIEKTRDPTRLLSLHCKIYPNFNYCPL